MDTKEIRLANLRALLAEAGGKQIRLAERLKKSASQLNQWFSGHRTITEDSAREIEANAKKPRGWLDQVHDDVQATGSAPVGGNTPASAPPTFAEALQVVTTTLTALGGVRRTMARSALHEAIDHPEMLDDTAAQIEEWLATESTSSKRTGTR